VIPLYMNVISTVYDTLTGGTNAMMKEEVEVITVAN
jgi:hypothetical protein